MGNIHTFTASAVGAPCEPVVKAGDLVKRYTCSKNQPDLERIFSQLYTC